MINASKRRQHERWLSEVTMIPTAAGREQRMIHWIDQWVSSRKGLELSYDKARNVIITQDREKAAKARSPLYITAHLDHPAFVVKQLADPITVELEFRGGVMDQYFDRASIEIFDDRNNRHAAKVVALDSKATPFKLVRAEVAKSNPPLKKGDVGRWRFLATEGELPRVEKGIFHTHACDDLAAVAAALAAFDIIRTRKGCEHVRLLFTRAEEVGFIGAIAASRSRSIPKDSRLLCLENSRSFAESPIGGGPILRVGDKVSVFEPNLTNTISLLLEQHVKDNPKFTYQRKLMPGGTCEATTFSTYGYQSTCICLPLGNYHNMKDIDGVSSGRKKTARVGPEHIAISDYHGMIEMLVLIAQQLDDAKVPSIRDRMTKLHKEKGFVLKEW